MTLDIGSIGSMIIYSYFFIASGTSMHPNIQDGDLLSAYTANSGNEYDFKNVRVGDVVAFKAPNDITVSHRVISTLEMQDEFGNKITIFARTLGDNNCRTLGAYDEVNQHNYLGKVTTQFRDDKQMNMTSIINLNKANC